jgi:hypothetical protein
MPIHFMVLWARSHWFTTPRTIHAVESAAWNRQRCEFLIAYAAWVNLVLSSPTGHGGTFQVCRLLVWASASGCVVGY